MKIVCKSEKELPGIARQLIAAYPKNRVFAFYGELGAGKTTFIKAICRELGVRDMVQSPTFAIISEYKRDFGDPVFHFDFYRINKLEEAFDIGYEEYFYSGYYCFIEWPERVEGLLPDDVVKVSLTGTGDREIAF